MALCGSLAEETKGYLADLIGGFRAGSRQGCFWAGVMRVCLAEPPPGYRGRSMRGYQAEERPGHLSEALHGR